MEKRLGLLVRNLRHLGFRMDAFLRSVLEWHQPCVAEELPRILELGEAHGYDHHEDGDPVADSIHCLEQVDLMPYASVG